MVPPPQARRIALAKRYYQRHMRSAFDDAVVAARSHGRVLCETRSFVAFVPFALDCMYQVVVAPKRESAAAVADFGRCPDTEMRGVALCVRRALAMLYVCKSDPDYNMVVRTVPPLEGDGEGEGEGDEGGCERKGIHQEDGRDLYYRWHVVLFPHHHESVWAGVRSYGEFAPNRGTPEEMAAELRATATPEGAMWALSCGDGGEAGSALDGSGSGSRSEEVPSAGAEGDRSTRAEERYWEELREWCSAHLGEECEGTEDWPFALPTLPLPKGRLLPVPSLLSPGSTTSPRPLLPRERLLKEKRAAQRRRSGMAVAGTLGMAMAAYLVVLSALKIARPEKM